MRLSTEAKTNPAADRGTNPGSGCRYERIYGSIIRAAVDAGGAAAPRHGAKGNH
jgi:hypothetical protein